MSTYTQILYQIVYSTKYREPTLIKSDRIELFKFIHGLLKKKNCHLYRINGVEDHLHILTHIHPTIALSNLVKDIKLASTEHIKKLELFPNFGGWQGGYGAFTYSINAKNNLINYIKNQEEHHREKSFLDELKELFEEHGLEFSDRFLL